MNEMKTPEQIEANYKNLLARKEVISKSKMLLEAELATRKRSLKEVMDECKKAGLDPDKIQDEIKRMTDIVTVQMDVFKADLDAAEELIKPMTKEIG